MKVSWSEKIRGLSSSRKFTKFFDGVKLSLPDNQVISLKVSFVKKRQSEHWPKFSKFSYFAKAETSHGVTGLGFGESEIKLLSIQKSIAESIERAVFLSFKPYFGLKSSNGWAAHLTQKNAQRSALHELLERDAVLVHWLTQTPFWEINPSTLPAWVDTWTKKELSIFNANLRLLYAHAGHIPVILSVITFSGRTYISQATSESFENAIYKSLAETCRIIALSIEQNDQSSRGVKDNEVSSPWDHALHYAGKIKFPEWPYGNAISYENALTHSKKMYAHLDEKNIFPKFNTVPCGDLFVSQCTSEKIQDLFFGGTGYALKTGLINTERLIEATGSYNLNLQAHCVP